MEQRERTARAIAGLYNNSFPQGMGFLRATLGDISKEQAYELADICLRDGRLYLDYLAGRVIKTQIPASGVPDDFRLYDRDLGYGAGERALLDGLTDPAYNP